MNRIIYTALLLALSFNAFGQMDSPARHSIGKVKFARRFANLKSDRVLGTDEFVYDSTGRLAKVLHFLGDKEMLGGFDEFAYIPYGGVSFKLVYRANSNSPTGFVLLESIEYFYSDSLLTRERTVYPLAHYTDSCTYEYNNRLLARAQRYSRGQYMSHTVYTYENGELRRETSRSTDDHVYQTVFHQYNNGVLQESRYYNFRDQLTKTIRYSYDSAGRLISEANEEAPFSNAMSQIIRYEY